MNKTAICGLRAALVIVFLLILLALGALILVGNYFYTFALDPNAKGGFGSAAGIVDSEYTRWLLKDSRKRPSPLRCPLPWLSKQRHRHGLLWQTSV